MTAYRIVRTLLDDPSHCQALVGLLDDYARDPMGGGTALSDYAREHLVARLRERTDFVSFLAFDGAQAIGLINGFEGFSTFAARPLLNIHDLTVRADYRGRGIARLLIDEAERAARARGCCKLTLEVLSNNDAALTAYARCGFVPYALDPAAGQALFMQKWL